MEIQQIKGFHAVAKFKNFTVAGKKTGRSQPTISLQIKALEDELGVKLFERVGPKKVMLTAEGELFREITTPLLYYAENVKTRFDEARGIYTSSIVRMATHSSVMKYVLPPVVKKFKSAYPQCQLVILGRSRSEIIKMLEQGDADFAVTSLSKAPKTLEYEVFSNFSRILIGSRGHPLEKKRTLRLADIAEHPLILPSKESNTRKLIDEAFRKEGLSMNLTMEVVSRDAVKTYVGMGLGISIISEYYVSAADRKNLFVRNMGKQFGKAETGILTRKGAVLRNQPRISLIGLRRPVSKQCLC